MTHWAKLELPHYESFNLLCFCFTFRSCFFWGGGGEGEGFQGQWAKVKGQGDEWNCCA